MKDLNYCEIKNDSRHLGFIYFCYVCLLHLLIWLFANRGGKLKRRELLNSTLW